MVKFYFNCYRGLLENLNYLIRACIQKVLCLFDFNLRYDKNKNGYKFKR